MPLFAVGASGLAPRALTLGGWGLHSLSIVVILTIFDKKGLSVEKSIEVEPRLSRGDRVSMWILIAAGAAIAVATAVFGGIRIVEVLGNDDVRVLGEFAGTTAEAPIGPDGALVEVELDRAVLTVPSLPVAGVGALVIQQLALVATTWTLVIALGIVTVSAMRGRTFSRRNTRLVMTAGIVGLLGYAAVPFFGNMGANAAFARISDRTFDNVIMSVDVFPFVLGAFVAALAGTVFVVGDRLRREAEGLV